MTHYSSLEPVIQCERITLHRMSSLIQIVFIVKFKVFILSLKMRNTYIREAYLYPIIMFLVRLHLITIYRGRSFSLHQALWLCYLISPQLLAQGPCFPFSLQECRSSAYTPQHLFQWIRPTMDSHWTARVAFRTLLFTWYEGYITNLGLLDATYTSQRGR